MVTKLTDQTLAKPNYDNPLAAVWTMHRTLQAPITIFWEDQHSAVVSCIDVVTARVIHRAANLPHR